MSIHAVGPIGLCVWGGGVNHGNLFPKSGNPKITGWRPIAFTVAVIKPMVVIIFLPVSGHMLKQFDKTWLSKLLVPFFSHLRERCCFPFIVAVVVNAVASADKKRRFHFADGF